MTYAHVYRYSSGVPTLFQGTRGRGRRKGMGRGRGIK